MKIKQTRAKNEYCEKDRKKLVVYTVQKCLRNTVQKNGSKVSGAPPCIIVLGADPSFIYYFKHLG